MLHLDVADRLATILNPLVQHEAARTRAAALKGARARRTAITIALHRSLRTNRPLACARGAQLVDGEAAAARLALGAANAREQQEDGGSRQPNENVAPRKHRRELLQIRPCKFSRLQSS